LGPSLREGIRGPQRRGVVQTPYTDICTSAQGSEDAYFGYKDATHRFWTVNVDSTWATASQMPADGARYSVTRKKASEWSSK